MLNGERCTQAGYVYFQGQILALLGLLQRGVESAIPAFLGCGAAAGLFRKASVLLSHAGQGGRPSPSEPLCCQGVGSFVVPPASPCQGGGTGWVSEEPFPSGAEDKGPLA